MSSVLVTFMDHTVFSIQLFSVILPTIHHISGGSFGTIS